MRKNIDARIEKLEGAYVVHGDDAWVMTTLRALSKIYGDGSEPEPMTAEEFHAAVEASLAKIYGETTPAEAYPHGGDQVMSQRRKKK